jgi:hypothetical protein
MVHAEDPSRDTDGRAIVGQIMQNEGHSTDLRSTAYCDTPKRLCVDSKGDIIADDWTWTALLNIAERHAMPKGAVATDYNVSVQHDWTKMMDAKTRSNLGSSREVDIRHETDQDCKGMEQHAEKPAQRRRCFCPPPVGQSVDSDRPARWLTKQPQSRVPTQIMAPSRDWSYRCTHFIDRRRRCSAPVS